MDTGQWVGSPGSQPVGVTDPAHDFYGYMEQTVPYATCIRTKFYRIESGREEWLDYERIVSIHQERELQRLPVDRVRRSSSRTTWSRSAWRAAYLRELFGDRPLLTLPKAEQDGVAVAHLVVAPLDA